MRHEEKVSERCQKRNLRGGGEIRPNAGSSPGGSGVDVPPEDTSDAEDCPLYNPAHSKRRLHSCDRRRSTQRE